jgi:hypothetical protein
MQPIHMQSPRRSLRVGKNMTVSIRLLVIIASVIISAIALGILLPEEVSPTLKTFELNKMLDKTHTFIKIISPYDYQDQANLANECTEYLKIPESDIHLITSTDCIEILRGTVSERNGS